MKERRQVPRYQFHAAGQISVPPAADVLPVTFTTMSTKGCRVRGAGLPAAGSPCLLNFEWEGREFQGEVRVSWRHSDGQTGLEFLPLSDEQREFIRGLCASLKLEIPPSRHSDSP
jgi:PilZ domain